MKRDPPSMSHARPACALRRGCSRAVRAASVVAWGVAAASAWSQEPDAATQDLMKSALVLQTFDHFDSACRRGDGPTDAQRAELERWQRGQGVDRLRTRVAALREQPLLQQQVELGARRVIEQAQPRAPDPCAAAVSVTRLDDAQFGRVVPALVARATDLPARSAPPASTKSAIDLAVLARIEGFAFDTRAGIGYGGMVTLDIYPVVMFRGGEALANVEGLAFPGGLDAHRRARPQDWRDWRRVGAELQTRKADGWQRLPFQRLYPQLPDNFRLDGSYRRLGGSGTLGIGGTSAVAVWNEYRFNSDGRVERLGGAGAQAEAGDSRVVTSSVAPERRGRYRVTGLVLQIDFDDGGAERMTLITDPGDPKGAIWLDGVGYAQRRR